MDKTIAMFDYGGLNTDWKAEMHDRFSGFIAVPYMT
jgi:hypothetical protein